jgi:hypothetical protein
MIDLTFLPSAISGLKTAADITTAIVKAKNSVEINAKAIELQGIILSSQSDAFNAQIAQMTLLEENRKLKDQLVDLEAFKRDMERYRLASPWSGSAVYALKEVVSDGEPPHYLCANCNQAKRKSIPCITHNSNAFAAYTCPNCKASIPTGFRGNPPAKYAPVPGAVITE